MPVAVPRTSSGRGAMALYAGGVALLGAVIVLALRSSEEAPTVTSVRVEAAEVAEPAEPVEPAVAPEPPASDGPTKVLEEARVLADTNIVMAHRRLADIPQDSTLRQTDTYRDIEQRWADEILRAANDSPDLEERRRLLDTVAKTPEVDPDRRARAANELAKLDETLDAVDVADLPTADGKGRKPPKPQAAVAMGSKAKPAQGASAPRRSSSPIPGKTQRVGMRPTAGSDDEADEPRTKPEADDTPPPPAPPPKAPPKQEAPRGDSEVIRDIPF